MPDQKGKGPASNKRTPRTTTTNDLASITNQIFAEQVRLLVAKYPILPLDSDKRPTLNGKPMRDWGNVEVTEANFDFYFSPTIKVVGMKLGVPHREQLPFADVDFDSGDAKHGADLLLPNTICFGHEKNPDSHRLLQARGEVTSKKFRDPIIEAKEKAQKKAAKEAGTHAAKKAHGGENSVIMELLRKGKQVRIPPSVTDYGAHVEYCKESTGIPAVLDAIDLERKVALQAIATLFRRYWPPVGSRHDTEMAFGGFAHNAGLTLEEAILTGTVLYNYLPSADQKAIRSKRFEKAIRDTYAKREKDEETTGIPRLIELMGDEGAACVKAALKWLDLPVNVEVMIAEWRRRDAQGITTALVPDGVFPLGTPIGDDEDLRVVLNDDKGWLFEGVEKIAKIFARDHEKYKVYMRGEELVRVVTKGVGVIRKTPFYRPEGNTHFAVLDNDDLRFVISRMKTVFKVNVRKNKFVTSEPSDALIKGIFSHVKTEWFDVLIPHIDAIQTIPVLQPDGTLDVTLGYRPGTRTYYDPGKQTFERKDVPKNKQEARALLETLEPMFCKFDFESKNGEKRNDIMGYVCVLSAIFCMVLRHLLPTVPVIGVTAPIPGSGKTKLVVTTVGVSSGRQVPASLTTTK
jgi:hypothetical protein